MPPVCEKLDGHGRGRTGVQVRTRHGGQLHWRADSVRFGSSVVYAEKQGYRAVRIGDGDDAGAAVVPTETTDCTTDAYVSR